MTRCKSPEMGRTFPRSREFAHRTIVAIVMFSLSAGCRPRSEEDGTVSTNTDAARLSTIHSRADLEQVLKPGMTTNAVLARLGPCSNVMTFPDGTLLWTYWLEPFPEESGLYVLAARLSITNGRVGNLG